MRLVKDLPDEVCALVYTGEMLQLLSNIIHNALDALPPNELCVSVSGSGRASAPCCRGQWARHSGLLISKCQFWRKNLQHPTARNLLRNRHSPN